MDNIKRIIPLRKYQLNHPVFVAFNIHLNHYNAYGLKHFERVEESLRNYYGANLRSSYLLPCITNYT